MSRIPGKRGDRILLAQQMAAGMLANPTEYPVPPFDPGSLSGESVTLAGTDAEAQVIKGQWMIKIEEGETQDKTMTANMVKQRGIARAMHKDNPAVLAMIDAMIDEPHSDPPGQPMELVAVVQGPGSVEEKWKRGEVGPSHNEQNFYRIERQIRDLTTGVVTEEWGVWQATTTETKILLVDQPRAVEISHRVVAVNEAGDSMPSNTVIVVL